MGTDWVRTLSAVPRMTQEEAKLSDKNQPEQTMWYSALGSPWCTLRWSFRLQISWKFEAQTGSIHGKDSLQQRPLVKFKYLHALECTTSFLWTLSVVRMSRELVFDVYANSPKSGARLHRLALGLLLAHSHLWYHIPSLPFASFSNLPSSVFSVKRRLEWNLFL